MTKAQRQRPRGVIELVDETSRPGTTAASTGPGAGYFEDFYRRELPPLLVLARALAGDLAAEDVAQESMVVAYRRWFRISDLDRPAGYVRGICARKALSPVRRRRAERRAARRLASRATSRIEPLSADGERFWTEVRRLPQRQAHAVALSYALDVPLSGVAASLGSDEASVDAHLSLVRSERGRAGAEELHARTTVDVDAGLADLYVRQARHRRRAGLVAAASVALAVGVGVGAGALLAHRGDGAPVPSRPLASQTYYHFPCQVDRVHCRGDHTYEFDLVRPVRWRIPAGFEVYFGLGESPLAVEVHRPDWLGDVTVLERVRASSPRGHEPARDVPDDPKAFVDWVASRPFLQAGPVLPVEMDGHPAWQVEVTLARGGDRGPGQCDGHRCHALTYQEGGGTSGVTGDMAAVYTAFRLAGAGTTVVWSRSFDGDPRQLESMDEAIAGISWPAG